MGKTKTGERARIQKLVMLAVFIAILLVLAFTPLGYLKVFAVAISLMMLPVLVGAARLGPVGGLILGLVFGITSFAQCFGMDAFGTYLFGVNPFFTFLMCVPTRMLAGLLCGIIYKALSRHKLIAAIVTSVAGPLLNTCLFVGVFVVCFAGTSFVAIGSQATALVLAGGMLVNGLIEVAVSLPVGTAVLTALQKLSHAPREIG